MATEAKKRGGFMGWYESYSGKRVVGMVYSLGASVVIVGALFKIQHLPGAGPMLFAGMITEAVLFAIGCFDKPHPEFHWEEVFPQLVDLHAVQKEEKEKIEAMPRPNLVALTGGTATNNLPAPAEKEKASVPSLSEKDLEALKGGINDLAKTAGQLSELGKVATATSKLGEKAEAAAEAADRFAVSANNLGAKNETLAASLSAAAQHMEGAVAGTKQYQQNVEAASAKAAQLTSIYEQQLTAAQAASAEAQKIQASVAAAAKEQEAYAAASKTLAKQVADLNSIYGNMLNALA
ncbi:MAG: gliding motility protein GldL [Paludibacteraceae bacterium]|nr:gliding motility protein GldL [Paludibacteraceae bacterium]